MILSWNKERTATRVRETRSRPPLAARPVGDQSAPVRAVAAPVTRLACRTAGRIRRDISYPRRQRVRPHRISMDGARDHGVYDLVRHSRRRFWGRGSSGVQPAIDSAQRRAFSLSAIPGNRRRSSTAADSSPSIPRRSTASSTDRGLMLLFCSSQPHRAIGAQGGAAFPFLRGFKGRNKSGPALVAGPSIMRAITASIGFVLSCRP